MKDFAPRVIRRLYTVKLWVSAPYDFTIEKIHEELEELAKTSVGSVKVSVESETLSEVRAL